MIQNCGTSAGALLSGEASCDEYFPEEFRMACRMDNAQVFFQVTRIENLEADIRLHEQALRESIRKLAQDPQLRPDVLCFLRPPMGGKCIGFAW